MSAYRHNDWNQLIGALVEVRKNHEVVRTGIVGDAIPDSSALWLAADRSDNRALIEAAEGHEVWVELDWPDVHIQDPG
jgi:hypothetical protein